MKSTDLEFGLALSQQAGWNQTAADWRRSLELSDGGSFTAWSGDQRVGAAASWIFPPTAWIGMMLVASEHRRKGIGKALMERAMAHLQNRGVKSIRLDATALGAPLYEKLGFSPQHRVVRTGGQPRTQPGSNVAFTASPPSESQWREILAIDNRSTHCDRSRFLTAVLQEERDDFRVAQTAEATNPPAGFIGARAGRTATYLGPCIAENQAAGRTLLTDGLNRFAGRNVMTDIFTDHAEAMHVVHCAGLFPQREFIRMTWGEDHVERTENIWSSSGPEKG